MSRGLFGWDLPPGVSVNDLPGNRREDEEYEKRWDDYAAKASTICPLFDAMWEVFDDELILLIDLAHDLGYAEGHNDGFSDAKLDQQLEGRE